MRKLLVAMVVAGFTVVFGMTTVVPVFAQEATASAPKVATLNINTATLEQFKGLPGIGQKTAERIIEYREKIHSFGSIEQLKEVKGIGEKSFEKIRLLVSVD